MTDKNKKIELIALDVDGTLLRSDKTISKKTIDCVHKAVEQGIKVVIATGRHYGGIIDYAKELNIANDGAFAICFNGSGIIDLKTFKPVYKQTLSSSLVTKITKISNKHNLDMHGYRDDFELFLQNEKNPLSVLEATMNFLPYKVDDFIYNEHKAYDYMKILSVSKDPDALDVLRKDIEAQDFFDEINIVRSDKHFLEYLPKHCSKGHALTELCKILSINIENAMAVGDAENDLEGIKRAGLGIAMKNATDILKESADVILPYSNDEDGVAYAIEKYALNNI